MLQLLAQTYDYTTTTSSAEASSGGMALLTIYILAVLAFVVVGLVGLWKMYVKAGQPGWAVLVPFYNLYVLLKIVNKPGWWLLLWFVPLVNIYVSIVVALELAKSFGKTPVFGVVGLWLFSTIGFLILGFGSAQYTGVGAAETTEPTATPPVAPAPPTDPTLPTSPNPPTAPAPPTNLVQ
jgi:hypothetical protein